MKVMLLNDTGIVPHIGCQAVSDAHVRMLAAHGHVVKYRYFVGQLNEFYTGNPQKSINKVFSNNDLMQKISDVDAVIVNGEGTIHHGAGLHYLAILAAAQELGKKTLIVNAVFQESYGFEPVLRKLDDFCVRDIFSSEFASKKNISNRVVLDSFIEAKFDSFKKPFIDLSEKVVVTDWHPDRERNVGYTLRRYLKENKKQCFYFPLQHGIQSYLWREAPRTLGACKLIITGRHHGVYLSAIAKKSFIALPSNTYKVEGLIRMSGLPIPVCSNPKELSSAIKFCQNNKSIYQEFFSFIDTYRPLSTFAALGKSNDVVSIRDELLQLEHQISQYSMSEMADLWPLASMNDNTSWFKSLMRKQVDHLRKNQKCREFYDTLPIGVKIWLKQVRKV